MAIQRSAHTAGRCLMVAMTLTTALLAAFIGALLLAPRAPAPARPTSRPHPR